jgi:MFS family permease
MYLTLLRNRNFLLLWLAQIHSTLASHLFNIGVMVTIFAQTGSALQAAGVLVGRTLPHVLLGPVAGALVDRYPRKQVLITMEVLRALLVGFSFFLVGEAGANVWVIYAVVAGLAVTDSFYKPAQMSLIPTLVEKPQLVHANSLVHSTNYGVMGIGYAIGGLMILYWGLTVMIVINLGLFLVAALMVLQLSIVRPVEEAGGKKAPMPLLRSVTQGIDYLRGHDLARALITMEFLEHWSHGLWTSAMMLAFTTQGLRVSEIYWGYQSALYFGGSLVGAGLAVGFAAKLGKRPGWVIIVNAFLMAFLTAVYALSPNVWFALVVSMLFGPPMAIRDVAQDSLLQSTVEGSVLGRVYATRQTLAMFAFMLSGIGLAWLADMIPVRQVYLIGAALYFVTAFYALSRQSMRLARLKTAPPNANSVLEAAT